MGGFFPTATMQFPIITFPAGEVTNFTPTTPGVAGSFVISSYPGGYDISGASIEEGANDIYITGLTPEPVSGTAIMLVGGTMLRRRRRR